MSSLDRKEAIPRSLRISSVTAALSAGLVALILWQRDLWPEYEAVWLTVGGITAFTVFYFYHVRTPSGQLVRLAPGAFTLSNWICSTALIATLALTLFVATSCFDVKWDNTFPPYHRQSDQPVAFAGVREARAGIRVVAISDNTVDAVVSLASESQFLGVTPDVRTWRAVHGHLMERVVAARPLAVVWNYYFPTPQSGDARFAAGVLALEEAGVPVALGVATYREDGTPELSPGIVDPLAGRLRHGAVLARDQVNRPGEIVIAIKRGQRTVIPGLPLTTLAAVINPRAHLDLEWQGRDRRISLCYELESGTYLPERDRIELATVLKTQRAGYWTRVVDILGCGRFLLERPERWEPRTIPYEMLLSCEDDELRALVMNKLIIIGDFRTAGPGLAPDRHRVKYGEVVASHVPGSYLLADAVAGLLGRESVGTAFPPAPLTFLLMLIAASVGCFIAMTPAINSVLKNPRRRSRLWISLLILSSCCFALMVLSHTFAAVHLGMAGFSLLTPMAGLSIFEFATRRGWRGSL